MPLYLRSHHRTAAVLAALVTFVGCNGPTLSPLDNDAIKDLQQRLNPKFQLDNRGRVMELSIEHQSLDGAAFAQISTLSELRSLSLYGSKFSDADIAKLNGLKRFESLGLGETNVTNKALLELAKMPSLRWLWLTKCRSPTNDRVADLKKALPGLTVYR